MNRVIDFINRLGLELNVDKCKSIHIVPNKAHCGEGKVFIGAEVVPQLSTFEATEYLGKPIGYRLFPEENKISKFIETGTQILTSSLAPWQKLNALKTFFYPSLSHAMRTFQHGKSAWCKLDDELRNASKTS